MIRKNTILICVAFCGFAGSGFAQTASAVPSTADHVPPAQPSGFKLFFEKVYLHLDRVRYVAGEDIWFKAYLINAQTHYSSNTSNNLYVELRDPAGRLASKEVIRLDNGVGIGDFRLGDSIPGGMYHLRAYTNWMKNFGNKFIFEKTLTVYVPAAGGGDLPGVRGAGYSGDAAGSDGNAARGKGGTQAGDATGKAVAGYDIQFLPEGGAMVEGVSGVVCLKATDRDGNGVEARGCILSSGGDTAGRFTTSWRGMGSFVFKPVAGGEYKALVRFGRHAYVKTEFPAAYKDGFVMNITHADTAALVVQIGANQATVAHYPSGELTLAARQAGKLCYREKIHLQDGQATMTIAEKDLPAGITAITLYDDKLHPQCERLVYIEEKDPVTVVIQTDKINYGSREKVVVGITAMDAQQRPVRAALSMAVAEEAAAVAEGGAADAGETAAAQSNIVSYFMLESELRGRIEAAGEYFDKYNSHRLEQMDLLLRTQGWNSFLWRRLADTSIRISYLPEAGLTVAGRVRETFVNKPLANMNITLFAEGARGDKLFFTKTDSAGRYYIDGLQLYGNQPVQINSKNEKGKKGGWIFMDTIFSKPLPVDWDLSAAADTSREMRGFAEEADKRWAAQKDAFHTVLPGVTVTKQPERVVMLRDQAATSFGYPEYNFTVTPKDYDMKTLENFLLHNIPGAQADVKSDGVVFVANGKLVRPRFIVDRREDVFNRVDYYNIPMEQINKVSVRHLVGQPHFTENARKSSTVQDGRDIFVIYLSLKPGATNDDLSMISTDVDGYYEARTFYKPNYPDQRNDAAPDTRNTLHWEPTIITDSNGKATVSYYNADPAATIRIEIEGLTDKGVPVAAQKKYEVK